MSSNPSILVTFWKPSTVPMMNSPCIPSTSSTTSPGVTTYWAERGSQAMFNTCSTQETNVISETSDCVRVVAGGPLQTHGPYLTAPNCWYKVTIPQSICT